jgi:hypothetical protein
MRFVGHTMIQNTSSWIQFEMSSSYIVPAVSNLGVHMALNWVIPGNSIWEDLSEDKMEVVALALSIQLDHIWV